MQAVGLLFILGAFLLGRQVVVGRVKETPQDIRDITLSVLSGDFTTMQSTLALRGENAPPVVAGTVAAGTSGGAALTGLLTGPLSSDLLANMVQLGSAAKGYRLGAIGPDYYDCSSLVWAAMKQAGIFNGARFTTFTFAQALGAKIKVVTNPTVGDIIVWNGSGHGHMGVVSGPNQVYAAMSPSNGIGYSTITGTTASVGNITPIYYRIAGS